ncbi:MAG: large-conductance mechanosensitive channel protein MscL [Taibaiella sp.]|nr:large-conductance mechanosensitive channel protein MscL [Taibaiella sp.]
MGLIKDFKAFALNGNVVDLAVGVIIGAAFGKIVSTVVEDIFMPIIGFVTPDGKMFADKFAVLQPAKPGDTYHSLDEAKKAGANVLAYGHLFQTIFDFLIIALCVFAVIKAIERFKEKKTIAPTEATKPPPTEVLLKEIRDELRKR